MSCLIYNLNRIFGGVLSKLVELIRQVSNRPLGWEELNVWQQSVHLYALSKYRTIKTVDVDRGTQAMYVVALYHDLKMASMLGTLTH